MKVGDLAAKEEFSPAAETAENEFPPPDSTLDDSRK